MNNYSKLNKQIINEPIKDVVHPATGDFHGGIHPTEFKDLSNSKKIARVTVAKELTIPLLQSNGKPSIPCIKPGDKVKQGQLIAKSPNQLGARLHSPIDSIVKSVNANINKPASEIAHHSITLENINIKNESDTQLETSNESVAFDWYGKSPEELLQMVEDAGIVGLGGAAFPTSKKLLQQSVETLIVNAMECEPYITCDDRMLRELPHQVIQGALIVAKIVKTEKIIFAIEDNKPEAIDSVKQAIIENELTESISIVVAPTKYPSGGEKQTIELVLNKQVPKNQLPLSIGVLVQNVATLHAVYAAVVEQKMLYERLVTITGNQVREAGNYWVALGTSINDLMSFFNISKNTTSQVIIGGPLMGKKISDYSYPVNKSTNSIIFNDDKLEAKPWLVETVNHKSCIRCGDCESVCPMNLLPQQLFWLSQSEEWDKLEQYNLFDCIDCGACAYVCPSEIPLVSYYRFAKSTIKHNNNKQQQAEIAKERFDSRELRLQRIKQERALKQQKAAEARRLAANNTEKDPSGKQAAINQALKRVKQKREKQKTEPQGFENDIKKDESK